MLITQSRRFSRRSLLTTTALGLPAMGLMGALNLIGATPASAVSSNDFVATAESRAGCPYVWGAEGPDAFDCSGLICWSLAQHGISIPHYSGAQIQTCIDAGLGISVDDALGTRGALLHYDGHVAISRGDGTTIEARSPSQGTGIFSAAGMGWTAGGLFPGVTYGDSPAPPPADPGDPADGYWGSDTTRHLQAVLGTPQDGVVSGQDIHWKAQNPGLGSGWEWVSAPTGSTVIRAMQERLGVGADGLIGPGTISALQAYLGTTVDGCFSAPSACVQELQRRVYAGQF